jgi:hypothetical protein
MGILKPELGHGGFRCPGLLHTGIEKFSARLNFRTVGFPAPTDNAHNWRHNYCRISTK